ncbi:MAG: winged helix-turn-helix domain-containing protein [Methanotrichaceae archaeon]
MRRTKEEIIVRILETCLVGANKTVIVYKSNLNFATVVPYLDSLLKNGFIASIEGPIRKYETTDRGKELLSGLKEIHKLL